MDKQPLDYMLPCAETKKGHTSAAAIEPEENQHLCKGGYRSGQQTIDHCVYLQEQN
jgi:hypothetical protein